MKRFLLNYNILFSICMCVCLIFTYAAFAQPAPTISAAPSLTRTPSWTPWIANESLWHYVLTINPKFSDLIGKGEGVYVGLLDLDFDQKNEVILSFRKPDDCGVDGCLFVVIYSKTKSVRAYIGDTIAFGRRTTFVNSSKVGR